MIVLLIAIAPPAVFSVLQAYWNYKDEVRSVEENLVLSARAAAEEYEWVISSARIVLTLLAAREEVRASIEGTCDEDVATVILALPHYNAIAIVNRAGKVVCTDQPGGVGIDLSDRRWFRELANGKDFVVSEVLQSRLLDARSIVIAVPLRNATGFSGAVSLGLKIDTLLGVEPQRPRSESSFVGLIDAKGEVLPVHQQGTVIEARDISALALGQASAAGDGKAIYRRTADGDRFVLTVMPMLDGSMRIVFAQPAATLISWSHFKLMTGLATPIVIWLLVAAVAWLGTEVMVIQWINYLQRLAHAYAKGRYSIRPVRLANAPTELRELGVALGEMLETIEARNGELKELVEYREMLIREIHHRVKNNFQIMGSLLNLHSRSVRDPAAAAALLTLRGRINALALVHRILYESNKLDAVALQPFFDALGTQLRELLAGQPQRVRMTFDVPAMMMDTDKAVALAMLVTEAVTNAFQHAFPDRDGVVAVTLTPGEGGMMTLTVADDGVGARTTDPLASDGLGQSLMAGFARQLGGTLAIEVEHGTRIVVTFPESFETGRAA
ncbi:MAG: sensor histidine kinase [Rhodospirillales bacterium]